MTNPASLDKTAWLIERRVSPPQWSVERYPTGVGAFYYDVQRAHRFDTKERAQEAMRRMSITPLERNEYFVSEHAWIEAHMTETPLKPVELIEVERDDQGRALVCAGCGTVETVRSIRARHPTAFTCCPERKMVPAWNRRTVDTELLEALKEQVGECFDPLCDMCARHQDIITKAEAGL